METSLESEPDILQLCLVYSAVIICIIGLMIHFLIVAVTVIDRLKGRPLTTADLLITCVATSRIAFAFASLLDLVLKSFSINCSTACDTTIHIIGRSSTSSNIWLSALLSVFYTLKITNFHNVVFLYLKKIILQRVLGLIIMFVLLTTVFSLGEFGANFDNLPKNVTLEVNINIGQIIMHQIFLLWDFLPMIFYVISSFTLLISLCNHMHSMKRDRNVRGHLNTYFKLIAFVIASLFCFALYMSNKMFAVSYFASLTVAGFFLFWNCFPVLHSISIVYMTSRLRSHYLRLLHDVTKCLLISGGSTSRSSSVQIQIISQ